MTVELTNRESLMVAVSDMYKDVHGVRPHFADWASYSEEQLSEWLDRLCADFQEQQNSSDFNDYLKYID